ncbi:MAG: aspartate/glutamate racemase family protein [Peptococcales bacterium]|jgi:allantoin racemase
MDREKKGIGLAKIGIIRVVTTSEESILYTHERIIKKIVPFTQFVTRAIADQPQGIYDQATEEIAIPKIVKLAKEMALDGCQGLVISCCADPALDLVREDVTVPVVGAGQAACLMAQAVGKRIGVISITETVPQSIKEQLGKNLVEYAKVEEVYNTLDLMAPKGKEKVIGTAKKIVQRGADCILLGCTGMATMGIATEIEKELAVPVIDPIVASGTLINYLVQRRNWQVRE